MSRGKARESTWVLLGPLVPHPSLIFLASVPSHTLLPMSPAGRGATGREGSEDPTSCYPEWPRYLKESTKGPCMCRLGVGGHFWSPSDSKTGEN